MDARQTRRDGRKGRPGAWAAVALMLWSALPVAAQAVERVALVIGNAAYEHTNPLRNPGNDARAVGEAFKRQGYSVTRLENADQSELRDALGNFKRGGCIGRGGGLLRRSRHRGGRLRGLALGDVERLAPLLVDRFRQAVSDDGDKTRGGTRPA